MLTTDSPLAQSPQGASPALSILAQGLSVWHALDAVAKVAAHLQDGSRCAILLPQDDRLILSSGTAVGDADRVLLEAISEITGTVDLINIGRVHSAEIRPLVTRIGELVGIIIVFDFSAAAATESAVRQLDEICSLATIAIEQKNLSEELSYRAHHDSLTHLWNRSWADEEIARALGASIESNRTVGLILIGIDSFRLFNELLGRSAADQLLRLISARFLDAIEPGASFARVGGDEFLVVIPDLDSEHAARYSASYLRSALDAPFLIGEHELIVRASFGIAATRGGLCHANDLQNQVEQALLYSKRAARGRISTYSAEMVKSPPERLVMERHLRAAMQKREFEIYYQPQINLLTGKPIGMEALLRWNHDPLGFISPALFVPIAEEIGIIGEIGEWVLDEAIRQLEAWNDAGLTGMRLAVNVSPRQFTDTDFATPVEERLRRSRIKPQDLELEITETAMMANVQHGVEQLKRLRAIGVQVALDDFGTGHSSLAYLQQLPIDRLKIDRMFVKSIVSRDERPPLLSAIIQMALNLGCQVIAEGIETSEQALALSSMNCEEAQGFLFSKPLPAPDLFDWMIAQRTAAD